MAGRWFRFYAAAMRHPKVAKLTDKEFRLWCELLSVAAENDGTIPPLDDLKHLLKRRLDHLSTGVERLISIGLIDPLEGGFEPHSWTERQYKSDTSTDRVQKHRRSRNVSETPPDTDTDTEVSVAKATAAEAAFVDPVKVMFDSGVRLLGEAGKTEAAARGWLGKAKAAHGTEAVIAAIGKAKREGTPDPIAFMQGVFRGTRREHEFTGPC